MYSLERAKEAVRAYLTTFDKGKGGPFSELVINEKATETYPFGWVFYYNGRGWLEHKDSRYAYGGNAPVIFNRHTGAIIVTGTARSTEYYVANYQRYGDPHAVPGPTVELLAWRPGANKVQATRTIKSAEGRGLASAKNKIDRCLAGEKVEVLATTAAVAEQLVLLLDELGFDAKQLAKRRNNRG